MCHVFVLRTLLVSAAVVSAARVKAGSMLMRSRDSKAVSASEVDSGTGLGCRNYCVKCEDGSTAWFGRRKSFTRAVAAPVAFGAAFVEPIEGIGFGLAVSASAQTCTKTSIRINKFQGPRKPKSGHKSCRTMKMLRRGAFFWRWREDRLDPAGTLAKGRNGSNDSDQNIYWQGCAVLMGRTWGSTFTQAFSFSRYNGAVAHAVKLCATHSQLCGKSPVVGLVPNAGRKEQCLDACENGAQKTLLTQQREAEHKIWRSQFVGSVVTLRITPEQANQIHVAPLSAVTGGEDHIPAEGSIGAVVTQAPQELQQKGLLLQNSLVTKVNGIDATHADFTLVEAWMQEATRTVRLEFQQHKDCPADVIRDLESKHLRIWKKSKSGSHCYVKCITAEAKEESRKISCRPQECDGDAWCFVPDRCRSCKKDARQAIVCQKPAGDKDLQASALPPTPELWQVNIGNKDLAIKSWKLASERIPIVGYHKALCRGGEEFLAVQEGNWIKLVDPPGYMQITNPLISFPQVRKADRAMPRRQPPVQTSTTIPPEDQQASQVRPPASWTLEQVMFEGSVFSSTGLRVHFDPGSGLIYQVEDGPAKTKLVQVGWQFAFVEGEPYDPDTFPTKVLQYSSARSQVALMFRKPVPTWAIEPREFSCSLTIDAMTGQLGETGLRIEPDSGVVVQVASGEQGQELGIETGWAISKVCGEPYDPSDLQELMQDCNAIVFRRPVYSSRSVVIPFDGEQAPCFDFDEASGIVQNVPDHCKAAGVSEGWVIEKINEVTYGEHPIEIPQGIAYSITFRIP